MTKPSKDFSERYGAAKRWRDGIRPLIEEAFSFCAPGRDRDFSSKTMTQAESDQFTSLGEEVAKDLGGDLVTYFSPAETRWANYAVITEVEENQKDQVLEIVQAREDDLFNLIQASNYNDIAPQWGFECAVHGTPALWVTASHLSQPVYVQIVPPSELLLVPGHLGILDRFRECEVYASTLPALFQGYPVDLTERGLAEKMKKPLTPCKVVWGFWLDWTDPALPVWKCEITVDGKRITPAEPITLGAISGACPLIVGRFNPQPNRPWGRGAGLIALPDMRTLSKVSETVLSGLDQSLMNTLIFADDGFLDLSNGLEAGRAYPASRGFTRDQIYDLSRNVNVDQGWFTEERLESRIRSIFYQDGPRQRGDTPPTAAQWLDERRRVQQRIGKPSAPLWSEFFIPLIQRFETLGVQLGKLPEAISHNGEAIRVMPISPLQKAQNQDQVMIARSNIEFGAAVLGEAFPQVIDAAETMRRMVRASGDDITQIASPDQVQQGAPSAPPPAA